MAMVGQAILASIVMAGLFATTLPIASADERTLAVQWDGIGLMAGVVIRDAGTRNRRIRVFLPDSQGECTGTLALSAGSSEGSWALACSSGSTATGLFTGRGDGRGGEGSGTDISGRQLRLVVGPRTTTSAVQAEPSAAQPQTALHAREIQDAVRPPKAAPGPGSSPPGAVQSQAKRFTTEEEVRAWAYQSLIETVSSQKVGSGTGAGQSYIGKPSNYRSIADGKVLAVCIDWARSSSTHIHSAGWYTSYQDAAAPRMADLREGATTGCARAERNGCRCQIIDENGKNVLKIPEEFLKRAIHG
jgi:hypothetical protein